MKKLLPIIFLCLGPCTTVDSYKIGEYTVNIAPYSKVNEEYQKVCIQNCSMKVKGFVNYNKMEMWSVENTEVVMHEIKHIVEGHFHSKQNFLQ
jgi:hypothetical protein